MTPRPYRIEVGEEALADLRGRLARTRWPDPIPGSGWEHGLDLAYLQELCAYWQTEYDWRAHERALNAHPQFMCEVDGLDLHF